MKSEKHLVESKRHLNVYITQENDKVERNKWKKILRLKKWIRKSLLW